MSRLLELKVEIRSNGQWMGPESVDLDGTRLEIFLDDFGQIFINNGHSFVGYELEELLDLNFTVAPEDIRMVVQEVERPADE